VERRTIFAVIYNNLNQIIARSDVSHTSHTATLDLVKQIGIKLSLYEGSLEDEEVTAKTPQTSRKLVEQSDDESYTPNMKKQLSALLFETGGLLCPTDGLRGAAAAHGENRPPNTPISQQLNPFAEDECPLEEDDTPMEETEDLEEGLKTLWRSVLGSHPSSMSSILKKEITRRLNLRPGSGMEIKITATCAKGSFNLNQIRLHSSAHLYFCFDTREEELYAFFLWPEEMRDALPLCADYQHSPKLVGTPIQGDNEDVLYCIKPHPRQQISKGKFAWDYLLERHRIPMSDLPQFLVDNFLAFPENPQ
jgi:hypothetical protein